MKALFLFCLLMVLVSCSGKDPVVPVPVPPIVPPANLSFTVVSDNVTVTGTVLDGVNLASEKAKVETTLKLAK